MKGKFVHENPKKHLSNTDPCHHKFTSKGEQREEKFVDGKNSPFYLAKVIGQGFDLSWYKIMIHLLGLMGKCLRGRKDSLRREKGW